MTSGLVMICWCNTKCMTYERNKLDFINFFVKETMQRIRWLVSHTLGENIYKDMYETQLLQKTKILKKQ